MVIGIDFDNTIVSYRHILSKLAHERQLIPDAKPRDKIEIRSIVRQLPNGETEWQELQAELYGRRMSEAIVMPGVQSFFKTAHKRNVQLYIISHKTKHSNLGTHKENLQMTALNWMIKYGFWGATWGLKRSEIFFESTRRNKIERLRAMNCTHFIDDLFETFMEHEFPNKVEKVLFTSHPPEDPPKDLYIYNQWSAIENHFFG